MTSTNSDMLRLLLADQDHDVRDQLEEFLSDLGYAVDVAHTTGELFTMTEKNVYRVIVFDSNVADQPLDTVLRQLTALPTIPGIIVMSGNPKLQSVLGAFRKGVVDYVIKPFDIGELQQTVRSAAQVSFLVSEFMAEHERMGDGSTLDARTVSVAGRVASGLGQPTVSR